MQVREYARAHYTTADVARVCFELVRDGYTVCSVRKSATHWALHLKKGA